MCVAEVIGYGLRYCLRGLHDTTLTGCFYAIIGSYWLSGAIKGS
jgi:hypothetical protein